MHSRAWTIAVTLVALAACCTPATAGIRPAFGGAVGIRVTPSNVDPTALSADLDLTMYTRFYSFPSLRNSQAGVTVPALPALDYGDGSSIPTTTLLLASPTGGPGGSAVWRSAGSFSHSYPAPGDYTVRAAMPCVACEHVSAVFFPPGSPAPTTFTSSYDYAPATVIGNLAATSQYSATTPTLFSDYSVRYRVTTWAAVTNTALVSLPAPVSADDIPTLHPAVIALLGFLLASAGWWVLRS